MTRHILCEDCDKLTRPSHPEDIVMGWKKRRTQIRAKKPEVHQVTVSTGAEKHVTNLASIVCDTCGNPIADGQAAFAHTQWQTNREGEPANWEKEFSQ